MFKRVSDYIPYLLNKYYITKTGNVYSQRYNIKRFINL